MAQLAASLRDAKKRLAYWIEHAVLDFTYSLEQRMRSHDVNRAELARRLGTSQAYITKILSGNANFTIKSMVSLCRALDATIHIEIVPTESEQQFGQFQTLLVPDIQVLGEQFRSFMEDAPACDNCGAITVRNGNCYLCHNCGNSMGCS